MTSRIGGARAPRGAVATALTAAGGGLLALGLAGCAGGSGGGSGTGSTTPSTSTSGKATAS